MGISILETQAKDQQTELNDLKKTIVPRDAFEQEVMSLSHQYGPLKATAPSTKQTHETPTTLDDAAKISVTAFVEALTEVLVKRYNLTTPTAAIRARLCAELDGFGVSVDTPPSETTSDAIRTWVNSCGFQICITRLIDQSMYPDLTFSEVKK